MMKAQSWFFFVEKESNGQEMNWSIGSRINYSPKHFLNLQSRVTFEFTQAFTNSCYIVEQRSILVKAHNPFQKHFLETILWEKAANMLELHNRPESVNPRSKGSINTDNSQTQDK